MKKLPTLSALIIASALILSACSNGNSVSQDSTEPHITTISSNTNAANNSEISHGDVTSTLTDDITNTLSSDESSSNAEPIDTTTLTINEFNNLINELPITITSTRYIVQDEKYKNLYPDMLQAVIQNNTEVDIKNAVIAFVAWDKNQLPVKIKGNIDFSDGAYIKEVKYSDINLIPGATYGNKNGYSIDEGCNISSFEAFPISFESFSGEKWINPYYNAWKELYEGVKYDSSRTVDVMITDTSFSTNEVNNSTTGNVDMSSIESIISSQDVKVVSTKYIVQDEQYKNLYPDMLQAVIENNTNVDIKNAVVAFVAWDENGLPVKIKGKIDFSTGAYIQEVNYKDINLIPGATYGNNNGFSIDESCGIKSFKAIVVSYEDFDGGSWYNPCYSDWCTAYSGVKLN